MRRLIGVVISLSLLCLTCGAGQLPAQPSDARLRALDVLWKAYTLYRTTGSVTEPLKGVNEALKIDPDLAYANIVRGEFAMKAQDWTTAKTSFERGLLLLKQPNQPLSPVRSATISPKEVEADSRCFLGYVYVKLAQRANREGQEAAEQRYLAQAQQNLRAGLSMNPGNEARELAEGLLRMFR